MLFAFAAILFVFVVTVVGHRTSGACEPIEKDMGIKIPRDVFIQGLGKELITFPNAYPEPKCKPQ